MTVSPSISVLILTRNEEQNLPGCLASVAWSDDIHVFDSMSSDKTVEIATRFGAKVTRREFDNWAAHQNWGLQNIAFVHPWVFYIDADERMTPELVAAVQEAVAASGTGVAFEVRRRDFFMGTWLRHVQATPYYLRLFRPEKMRYERLVNPVSIPDGPTLRVSGFFDHYPFSKGLGDWIQRHNSYSTYEALEIEGAFLRGTRPSFARAIAGHDLQERRYHQKQLFYRLPFRPLVRFLILYVGRRGFLDGSAGFTYAVLQAIYEYFIVLKTRELKKQRNP